MKMDVEGGDRVIHRSRRTCRLAVVVAVQNMLVMACLVVTLYVYWDLQSWESKAIHIQFDPIGVLRENKTIKFPHSDDAHMMELSENQESIRIQCNGPYIFYMEVCYSNSGGKLQLQVRNSSISSFTLDTTASTELCRGLHSTVYLRANEKVSLHLYSPKGFLIYNMTVGVSYLLGTKCDY